ncbi:uroporphyrinogen-III synthase [Halobacillus litoralis]|uniref:Uroporphyrinogen-III synthase n=1 Tax=Halobacillus litoralis TaxID=45668 RepID=A0A845DQQ9_9BACI|nr:MULTISPECIES: uroporphyrinogen-III synthase [Halobacillus]MYL19931.1 uroporphyrinogen-III synthase [Halobacillus litoralis]MYL29077.1 uroporphyrinogen-III synthase [Halobacillus halophilus]MYL37328.1 uroporphyrinogen-III synthase [Halobacillus litoralis]
MDAPLHGKNILITRGRSQAAPLKERIEEAGGVPRHTPLLAFQLNDQQTNEPILDELHEFSWIFLTSSNAVKFFFKWLHKHGRKLPADVRTAVIGTKTERALQRYGRKADFLPASFQAAKMEEEFFQKYPEPGKLLYIRGNRSRDVLPAAFRKRAVFFKSLTVYDTLLLTNDQKNITSWLENGDLDALTFTSPSTIQAFKTVTKGSRESGLSLPCFCIGPTTARKAETEGFTDVFTPPQYTIEHMVEQMILYFKNEGNR